MAAEKIGIAADVLEGLFGALLCFASLWFAVPCCGLASRQWTRRALRVLVVDECRGIEAHGHAYASELVIAPLN
jgi:hypothetical protein